MVSLLHSEFLGLLINLQLHSVALYGFCLNNVKRGPPSGPTNSRLFLTGITACMQASAQSNRYDLFFNVCLQPAHVFIKHCLILVQCFIRSQIQHNAVYCSKLKCCVCVLLKNFFLFVQMLISSILEQCPID